MIWVGSFKSLQTVLGKHRFTGAPLDVHTRVRSEIALISPLVDWLMNLIATSHCVCGEEQLGELALREALSNAMLHGNRLDARKLVHVRCCCECGKGVFIVVRDQGQGFDPNGVPDPLAFENLNSEHGRGIHLMKLAMDEVSFERGGTQVHMHKGLARKQETPAWRPHERVTRMLVSRPSPGVRVAELRWPSSHAVSQTCQINGDLSAAE
jgi:anti-sigma regulatory factor (Ser/Thr protein kinase)